jgi:fatty acid hydroxylase domain-containing protein 2
MLGTNILTLGLYWLVGSIYMFMDITNWPRWIRKYKVQPGINEPVDKKRLFTVRRVVI